ncbi:MAG: nuclear transport factor 2 family protein [Flavobacteriaceae bacterium]
MKKFVALVYISILTSSIVLSSCKTKHEEKHGKHGKHENHSEQKFDQTELANVKSAITDYVEGLYLADSTRIEKSVDTTMRKIGYWYDGKKNIYIDNLPMTYDQLVRLSARWNKDGKRVNSDSPKKIDIFDVNSKTASAKLTAEWGVDYFHLSKVNNQWKIMNVIWQSMPETAE